MSKEDSSVTEYSDEVESDSNSGIDRVDNNMNISELPHVGSFPSELSLLRENDANLTVFLNGVKSIDSLLKISINIYLAEVNKEEIIENNIQKIIPSPLTFLSTFLSVLAHLYQEEINSVTAHNSFLKQFSLAPGLLHLTNQMKGKSVDYHNRQIPSLKESIIKCLRNHEYISLLDLQTLVGVISSMGLIFVHSDKIAMLNSSMGNQNIPVVKGNSINNNNNHNNNNNNNNDSIGNTFEHDMLSSLLNEEIEFEPIWEIMDILPCCAEIIRRELDQDCSVKLLIQIMWSVSRCLYSCCVYKSHRQLAVQLIHDSRVGLRGLVYKISRLIYNHSQKSKELNTSTSPFISLIDIVTFTSALNMMRVLELCDTLKPINVSSSSHSKNNTSEYQASELLNKNNISQNSISHNSNINNNNNIDLIKDKEITSILFYDVIIPLAISILKGYIKPNHRIINPLVPIINIPTPVCPTAHPLNTSQTVDLILSLSSMGIYDQTLFSMICVTCITTRANSYGVVQLRKIRDALDLVRHDADFDLLRILRMRTQQLTTKNNRQGSRKSVVWRG